jgi:hypothetical protein
MPAQAVQVRFPENFAFGGYECQPILHASKRLRCPTRSDVGIRQHAEQKWAHEKIP